MPAVTTTKGEKVQVKVGDGASPEVFAHPCLINTTRGIAFSAEGNSIPVPDCSNPSDPAWVTFIKSSVSGSISGAGLLHVPDTTDYFDWVKSADAKNIQFVVGDSTAPNGGYFSGAFQLTEFSISGEARENLAECELTLVSSGAITFTAHT